MSGPTIKSAFNYAAPSPADTDVQEFRSSGTWIKPAGANMVQVECIGGGGGGAGGTGYLYGGASTAGASGGGGAGYSTRLFRASDLPSTVAVTIGAGGTGGNGSSTSSGNGAIGTNGGDSYFGTFLAGYGGGYGNVSTTTSSAGGGGGGVFNAAAGSSSGQPTTTTAQGHFGGGNDSNYSIPSTQFTTGSGWGGGRGGVSIFSGTSSLLGGGGGGGVPARSVYGANTILPGSTCGGQSGNITPQWVGSYTLGGAGVPGVNGSGGYGGHSAVYDGASYTSIVKYGTYYICPTPQFTTNGPASATLYNIILRSTDGVTWNYVTTNVKILYVFIGADSNLYGIVNPTAFTRGSTTIPGLNRLDFYTSTDGATWTYFSSITGTAGGLLYGWPVIVNGYYVYHVGNNTTTYMYSSDLITWSAANFNTAPNSANVYSYQICFCNGEYIAKANGNTSTTNLQVASNIAGPWSLRTTGLTGAFQCITTNGTRLVAQNTAASPYIYYSDVGGGAWTLATGTVTGANPNKFETLSYVGTNFIASYQSNLWYSADGATWATATDGTTNNYGLVIFADSKYTLLSTSTTSTVAIYATTPGGTWTATTFTSYGAGGAGGAGGYPGGGGGAGGTGTTGGVGGAGAGGMVRVTSW